eukprot:8297423-Lingulodinium_polyedra.AAC.1
MMSTFGIWRMHCGCLLRYLMTRLTTSTAPVVGFPTNWETILATTARSGLSWAMKLALAIARLAPRPS